MAYVEDLIAQVSDEALRNDLLAAVNTIKGRSNFGLVYEERIPENVALSAVSLEIGSKVQRRDSPGSDAIYEVTALTPDTAKLEPVTNEGEPHETERSQLLVVKPFGEPVYTGLASVGALPYGGEKPFHPVINGENYHALQLLVYLYQEQVDCIYIDPPYNTGATSWKYNNRFVDGNDRWKHSKWLSFMEKRLRLAKRLLNPSDGVLVVTIDENELAHLYMLLEQLFPTYDVTPVTIVNNPRGQQGDNFSFLHEYALFVIPSGVKALAKNPIEGGRRQNLRNWGGESRREDAAKCFYPIYVQNDEVVGFGDVLPQSQHPESTIETLSDGTLAVWPIDDSGIERKWRYARHTVDQIFNLLRYEPHRGPGQRIQMLREAEPFKTVWQDPRYDSSTHGRRLLGSFIEDDFEYPKSLYAVRDALYAVTAHKPDGLVLDFFAGSGTTLHATMLLNAEDQGSRQCILVTNNEVGAEKTAALQRNGHYRGDQEFERHGIFESVTKPRIRAAVTGVRSDGEPVPGRYSEHRAHAEGLAENVEFFSLEYLDPDDIDLGAQYDAIVPALWLAAGALGEREGQPVEGSYSIPEGSTYAVLFDEAYFLEFKDEVWRLDQVTHVYLVTDSPDAYAEMASQLPGRIVTSMLYGDYLRNFIINTEAQA